MSIADQVNDEPTSGCTIDCPDCDGYGAIRMRQTRPATMTAPAEYDVEDCATCGGTGTVEA
jgi:DnaJ-class molecular chaperone